MIGAMHAAKRKRIFAPVDSSWIMTFNDEFSGTSLKAAWSASGNHNDSNVQLTSANASVANSRVRLAVTNPGGTIPYNAVLLFTNTFSYTFPVYVEIRALMPPSGAGGHDADGIYPALWGNGFFSGGANTDPPEIDFLEYHGESPYLYIGAYLAIGGQWYSPLPSQYMAIDQTARHSTFVDSTSPHLDLGWHVWGFYWTSTTMTWYIDGISQGTMTSGSSASDNAGGTITWTAPASSYAINLILENQPGLNAANVTVNTVFPSYCYVDYVHVYQQSGSPATVDSGYGGPGDTLGSGA